MRAYALLLVGSGLADLKYTVLKPGPGEVLAIGLITIVLGLLLAFAPQRKMNWKE